MITEGKGNLLDANVEALVNTVNTDGIMGKGIALQFKQAFPENFRAYEAACKSGEVRLGRMFVFRRDTLGTMKNPRFIINFPTKLHWRNNSKLGDIDAGLRDLVRVVKEEGISSIALPPLGCGNGKLSWSDVQPRIRMAFEQLPKVHAIVFAPTGAPRPEEMKIGTTRPSMTAGRAVLLVLMDRYAQPGYRLTLLEVQKLAYFLQLAGQPLKLQFEKNKYGPYAETLHHVLQRMDGHFIRGYGDRSQQASITLDPTAVVDAEKFLSDSHEINDRFGRVERLIDGFETPYGMELLATVHWVANDTSISADEVVRSVYSWNEHKKVFRSNHIVKALNRLREEDWLVDAN